jgi:hypothetical protein
LNSASALRTSTVEFAIHGLAYPIAIDNDFAIWRAFGNDAWPAKYLFDERRRLVRRWVGDGSV